MQRYSRVMSLMTHAQMVQCQKQLNKSSGIKKICESWALPEKQPDVQSYRNQQSGTDENLHF